MFLLTVRYGVARILANFRYQYSDVKIGDRCIVKTDNGTEVGIVCSNPKELKQGENVDTIGMVLRKIALEDIKELEKINKEKIPQILAYARQKVESLGLELKISLIDYVFGGEKVTFYFIAKERVDFRELIKQLGQEYKTRIEMKQIGVRDEARLLSDLGHCGYELCCRAFIKETEAVTMKMAKNQKATLDPLKISGLCGRLMCCLRYEDETYNELRKKLPRKGTVVKTKNGVGEVIDLEVLAQKIIIELENDSRIKIGISDIIEIIKEPSIKVNPDEEKEVNGA
ncbi:MAG: regulatory iron-sulfur-containing complex subunit RicT [Planctomycetota bacterium]